jgi:hypothetical protein
VVDGLSRASRSTERVFVLAKWRDLLYSEYRRMPRYSLYWVTTAKFVLSTLFVEFRAFWQFAYVGVAY